MKKILFIISRFLDGGIDTVLVEVLRMLAEDKQYSLTLAIAVKMDELEVYNNRLPQNIRIEYLAGHPLLYKTKLLRFKNRNAVCVKIIDEMLVNPVRRKVQQKALNKLIAEHDIVIDFDACHTAFLKNCRKPTFAWVHFSLLKLLEQDRKRTLRITQRLKKYDKVVLICKAMQDEVDRHFPELKEKTAFVYNALDVAALQKRAKEPITSSFPYILAVERLAESQKDISTLLKAYSMLNVPEHLVIIGKGADKNRLMDYAKSLGLNVSEDMKTGAKVHFIGFQANPHAWMAQAKMLVHSAKFEGFGLAIAEALLLGLPIVATDCPVGPREILDDGKAGLLVPVGNAEALAEAISNIITNEDLRQQLLVHAKEHSQNFTKEKIKPQLDALLRHEHSIYPQAKQG